MNRSYADEICARLELEKKIPKDLPKDSEIIDRAKRLLLTMKGFGMVQSAPQSLNFPAKTAERLVALAMLGTMLDEVVRSGTAIEPDDVKAMWQSWVGKTALLVGDIVEDNANG